MTEAIILSSAAAFIALVAGCTSIATCWYLKKNYSSSNEGNTTMDVEETHDEFSVPSNPVIQSLELPPEINENPYEQVINLNNNYNNEIVILTVDNNKNIISNSGSCPSPQYLFPRSSSPNPSSYSPVTKKSSINNETAAQLGDNNKCIIASSPPCSSPQHLSPRSSSPNPNSSSPSLTKRVTTKVKYMSKDIKKETYTETMLENGKPNAVAEGLVRVVGGMMGAIPAASQNNSLLEGAGNLVNNIINNRARENEKSEGSGSPISKSPNHHVRSHSLDSEENGNTHNKQIGKRPSPLKKSLDTITEEHTRETTSPINVRKARHYSDSETERLKAVPMEFFKRDFNRQPGLNIEEKPSGIFREEKTLYSNFKPERGEAYILGIDNIAIQGDQENYENMKID